MGSGERVLGVMSKRDNSGWWDSAVGYEVYLRSFFDSNGDGVGDIRGLATKLDYLVRLGVDLVWVSPFYPSPMADFGYDVRNYCDVDPIFGNLDDFDYLVSEVHRLGLRLLIDLVPNHTSIKHDWFVNSRASIDSERRGYYHWRDPSQNGGPPNNWVSHFGGPAWTFDEGTGQYYLHLFLPEQPDLNWSNPNVVNEFDEILRFWLKREVDGFRIDVAQGLVKNMLMPDNPLRFGLHDDMSPREVFASYDHRYDLDQAGNLEIYQRWRKIADEYDALLLGEVYLRDNDPNRVSRYVSSKDALHRAFYFAPMHVPWSPDPMWDTFRDALDAAPEDLSWALSSHDDPRAPTRFGGGDLGKQRALAYAVLLLFLPGLPFLYQGDELGLESIEVEPEDMTDPIALRNEINSDGRDGARSPIPWNTESNFGFSTVKPWLPVGSRLTEDTVENQESDEYSTLAAYKELIDLRNRWLDPRSTFRWLTSRGSPIISFMRSDLLCALNVGDQPSQLDIETEGFSIKFSVGEASLHDGTLELGENSAVLLTSSL